MDRDVWTRDGYPDPEAETFSSHDEAREWALQPASGRVLAEVSEAPWSTTATFRVRHDEEYVVVHRAKVMAWSWRRFGVILRSCEWRTRTTNSEQQRSRS